MEEMIYQPQDMKFGDFVLFKMKNELYCLHIQREKGELHEKIGNSFGLSKSGDGFNWTYLGTVLKPSNGWDGYLMGMDVFYHKGKRYLIYSAREGNDDMKTQQMGIIEMKDLFNMKNPVVQSITNDVGDFYYPPHKSKFAWRDPFVIRDKDMLYALIVAKNSEKPIESSGCVGLLSTKDLTDIGKDWERMKPIFNSRYNEIETPTLYRREGKFFLLFGEYTNGMNMRYAVSDKMFGPFEESETNILTPAYSYAGRLINIWGEDRFFHWIRNHFVGKQETYMAPPKIAVFEDSKMLLKKDPNHRKGEEYIIHGLEENISFKIEQTNRHIVSIEPTDFGIYVGDFGRQQNTKFNEHTIPIPKKRTHVVEKIHAGKLLEIYVDDFYAYGTILDSLESKVTIL